MSKFNIIGVIFLTILAVAVNGQTVQQGSGQPQVRRALVIGNSIYHAGVLSNPGNDARAMADVLQKLGFKVYIYEDLGNAQIKKVIDDFGSILKGVDVALFYYAGHGIQAKGYNYLIPVDADLKSEEQVEYDCVRADRILALMETSGTKVNILILDACRNNPFERSWTRSPTGKGLAFMSAPRGSLIAYATAPGSTASDGSGKNGLYTSALLESIQIPDITITQMFQNVRNIVVQKSQEQQTPWESTSLTADFYFNPQSEEITKSLSAVEINVSEEQNKVEILGNDYAGTYSTIDEMTGQKIILELRANENGTYSGSLNDNYYILEVVGQLQDGSLKGSVGEGANSLEFEAYNQNQLLIFTVFSQNSLVDSQVWKFTKTGISDTEYQDKQGEVIINNIPLSEDQIREIKSRYGVEPLAGNYWYDSLSGLYGVTGYPAYGFMYPGHNFGSLSRNASAGNTNVIINGRELPQIEWAVWSYILGYYIQPGNYWLDAQGNAGYVGYNTPVVNLFVAAQQNAYSGQGSSGDNFWSTRFGAGNSNADNTQGYVSVPGYGPIGYGF